MSRPSRPDGANQPLASRSGQRILHARGQPQPGDCSPSRGTGALDPKLSFSQMLPSSRYVLPITRAATGAWFAPSGEAELNRFRLGLRRPEALLHLPLFVRFREVAVP